MDLRKALNSFANEEPCFTRSASHHTSHRQAITKHSALYRATFTDDSYKLEIPGASGMHTPALSTAGQIPGSQATPTALLESQNLGTFPGLAEGNPGIRGSQDAFSWPRDVPDIWDQISLFRGPFDDAELDDTAADVG